MNITFCFFSKRKNLYLYPLLPILPILRSILYLNTHRVVPRYQNPRRFVGSANLSFSPPLRRRGYRERWSPFKVVRGRGMFEKTFFVSFFKKENNNQKLYTTSTVFPLAPTATLLPLPNILSLSHHVSSAAPKPNAAPAATSYQ